MKTFGILTGSDRNLEWMIPWWYSNYKAQNNLPIAIADFGLSEEGKNYTKKIATLVSIPEISMKDPSKTPVSLKKKWEKVLIGDFWPIRKCWFKKALAFFFSPFDITLWIDIDCLIRVKLNSIKPSCNNEAKIALCKIPKDIEEFYRQTGLIQKDEPYLSSGVVLFKKSSPIIQKFYDLSKTQHHLFLGDQCLLSHILYREKLPYSILPDTYNWHARLLGLNPEAHILHFPGSWGKAMIKEMMNSFNTLSFNPLKLE